MDRRLRQMRSLVLLLLIGSTILIRGAQTCIRVLPLRGSTGTGVCRRYVGLISGLITRLVACIAIGTRRRAAVLLGIVHILLLVL